MMLADLFTSGSAVIPACGRYRYFLRRSWDETRPHALFIMLNPSTADAEADDATIRRCKGFARAWDLGGIRVVNLFAWRATRPADLNYAHLQGCDVIGPANDDWIGAEAWKARHDGAPIVCAWGTLFRWALDRELQVLELLGRQRAQPQRIALTAGGFPGHPLYLPADAQLQEYGRR